MCTAVDSGEVIILSDEDSEDVETDTSVLFVEVGNVKKNDSVLSLSAVDEDLVVTFSRRADLLPHARYDCPIHPFIAAECEISAPVDNNHLMCEQCFCYVCDKLASACEVWCSRGVCHCNSHKKSSFWSDQRNSGLLGELQMFNFTLSEIDSHLRHAESLLQIFKRELSVRFCAYLNGKPAEQYGSRVQGLVFDYFPVYSCVSEFLNLADEQNSRAAAIMKLGAAQDFLRHFPQFGVFPVPIPMANAAEAIAELLHRVVSSLQRQMVMGDLTTDFSLKLQEFYNRLLLPSTLRNMKNSLRVRLWDDVLLVSVLKGQNVSGVRKDKGKKDVLMEQMSTVLLRTERLQQQQRYRELCRYLRVVQTDDPNMFQRVLDLVPFFQCLDGDLSSALHTLVSSLWPRLTPHRFLLYLRIFETATAPIQVVSPTKAITFPHEQWDTIKGAVPLKRLELVKFALRVQSSCSVVNNDSGCWVSVFSLVTSPRGSSSGLPEPRPDFLHSSKDLLMSILTSQNSCNLHIPRNFHEVYPDQALLLLLTQAFALRILKEPALSPLVPVLRCFQKNTWALRWLLENLSFSEHLTSFTHQISLEISKTDESLGFLQTVLASSPIVFPPHAAHTAVQDQREV